MKNLPATPAGGASPGASRTLIFMITTIVVPHAEHDHDYPRARAVPYIARARVRVRACSACAVSRVRAL